MALDTKIAYKVSATKSDTLDRGSQKALHEIDVTLGWPSGTAASQADEIWSDTRTVNAAAFDNLDLTNLTQLDSSGGTLRSSISFAVVKLVLIRNVSTSGHVLVGGGTDNGSAADAWALAGGMFQTDASLCAIPFGGALLWYEPAGVAVTNSSADVLCVGGVTANQTYQIIILGEST